jgi:signal peptidase I
MSKKWKNKILHYWRQWRSLVVIIFIVTAFRSAIADWNDVPTGSMKPTILEGDRIYVNKVAYDLKFPFTRWRLAQWSDPSRGEVVVFISPADGKRLVKRVIGVPGDIVILKNNRLIINGKQIEYGPLDEKISSQIDSGQRKNFEFYSELITGKKHPVMFNLVRPSVRSFGPVAVPEGSYLMMGDNRDDSADSRYFGFVERDRIIGRATAIALSLDRNHYYRPRWHRFFRALP